MTPGEQLVSYVENLYEREKRPLVLVETGCMRSTNPDAEQGDGWSTLAFAKWVYVHGGSFTSCELDPEHVKLAEDVLDQENLYTQSIGFHTGESLELLRAMHIIDFAYLDSSDDLDHALEEFKICEQKGAKLIVMDDWQTKAQAADMYARSKGYQVTHEGRFTVIELARAATA